jgi:hypothetical protein
MASPSHRAVAAIVTVAATSLLLAIWLPTQPGIRPTSAQQQGISP